jgi:hypothetical protein
VFAALASALTLLPAPQRAPAAEEVGGAAPAYSED